LPTDEGITVGVPLASEYWGRPTSIYFGYQRHNLPLEHCPYFPWEQAPCTLPLNQKYSYRHTLIVSVILLELTMEAQGILLAFLR
jgi:hypothetical protein